ncbi:phage head-tail adaptor, putative, SPP1 family [Anaerovirgula multivorans]|uniref:Phage head-tail adaptor, putative, SPP1 family n=1 Tax=Anaerovirgula multivorans TaxID=312168 RepID=A0A238ZTJ2_9FIRM|nr:phage head closure protein [Anaerovirgula multivorans]SNR85983.1 phage head-tail adaptor, putative, SPP1 family [Anaerovirgula multivorans]
MNPGRLNKRIEVWYKVKELNDLKQTVQKDKFKTKLWAAIIPQTGKSFSAPADTKQAEITHKIEVRYRNDLKSNMHIKYRGRRFDIKYILDPYEKHEKLEIYVSEVVE